MAETQKQWPDWMPCPTVDGYGIQVVDRRINTEMEVGDTKRVEFDTDECIANCALFCDSFQASFFETFEKDILIQGSKWFSMGLWIGGQIETHSVRFKDRPQITGKTGSYTQYGFTLNVSKRGGLMDKDMAEILLEFGPEFINSMASRLHYILHVEAPKVTNVPANIWTATSQDWENAK